MKGGTYIVGDNGDLERLSGTKGEGRRTQRSAPKIKASDKVTPDAVEKENATRKD